MTGFLTGFPGKEELQKKLRNVVIPQYREANCHIHTPYSFSSFSDLETLFEMALTENIHVLGINDFYVTDGYNAFCELSLRNSIFPLFNLEFIGLMKKEQRKGIRINDPNNPGRIYFCGKGLDYPFHTGWYQKKQLDRVIGESQNQIRAMITKLNSLIGSVNPSLSLTYEHVKKRYALELVRERHLARALRMLALEEYGDESIQFIELLYGGKKSGAGSADPALLENEIRSNLLKSGGAAFVEEDVNSFLPLDTINEIILKAGGIPCYPVLLDDPSGNYTEFEADPEQLFAVLTTLRTGCIELIPGRNDPSALRSFVEYFHDKGFIITFGTEHNTPEPAPLTVTSGGRKPLDDYLKGIAWEGACVIAAHQYLRANKHEGYVSPFGIPKSSERDEFAETGRLVIEYFLNNTLQPDETRN
ncbi:MAG: hypothetical protein K0B05_09710 [Bacteroidales bacterium]|nr:hypothetical protein [Bacteroidales bacterium]